MKKLLGAAAVLWLSSSAFGLGIKIFGGIDWAWYKKPQPGIGIPEISFAYGENRRQLVGLGFEIPLLSFIRADIGLQYFQKGTINESYYLGALLTRQVYNLDAISIPLCVKFNLFAKSSPYLLAGGELSYVVRHEVKAAIIPQPSVEYDLGMGTKCFDFGLVMGGGAEIVMAGGWTPFVEIRYCAGLINLNNPIETFAPSYYLAVVKTRALALQAGVRYTLRGKKR